MASSPQPRFFSRSGLVFLIAAAVIPFALASAARADTTAWPRRFDSLSGSFVIYQPQPESVAADLLSCRAAFSLLKNDWERRHLAQKE